MFLDRVSPCSPGWPGANSIDHAGLEITEIHPPLHLECWNYCESPHPVQISFKVENLAEGTDHDRTGLCLSDTQGSVLSTGKKKGDYKTKAA